MCCPNSFILFLSLLINCQNSDHDFGKAIILPENKIKIRVPMAKFEPILKKTFKFEGGYQQYPSDKANYNTLGELIGTNRGISAIALEEYLGYPPTVADIKAVTVDLAKKIYKKLFWDKIRGDDLKDQDVADIIFATYIGNPAASNKMIAKALKTVQNKDYVVRSPYSDEVVRAINKSNPKKLFYTIKEEKRLFLESLRMTYPQFINGWMNKLNSFEYEKEKRIVLMLLTVVAISGVAYFAYKKGYYNKIIKQFT